VTIQAKNSAGVNLPRAVIITMTFPNASKASFTSTSTGLTTISNVPVGVNHYTVWWGAILVSSSISLTVTGITSTSITTTVQQLTDGSYYALFALNNTVIVPISYQSKDDLIWPGQTAPSSPVFKADVANWRSSGQPTTFRTGAWLIDRSLSSWTWSNGILQCGTSFTVSTADMELLWATVVDPSWPPAPTTPTTPTTPPVDNGTSILVPSSTNPTGVIPQDTTTTTQPRLSVDTTTLGIVIVGIIACVVIAIGYLSKHANNASLWTKKKSPRAKDGKVAKKFKKRGKR
jgi:hypothetical protein